MADFTIEDAPWADASVVKVWPAVAQTTAGAQPQGPSIASGTVASRRVTFTGLDRRTPYVAYAAGVSRRFVVPLPGDVAENEQERLANLELGLALNDETAAAQQVSLEAVETRVAAQYITGTATPVLGDLADGQTYFQLDGSGNVIAEYVRAA